MSGKVSLECLFWTCGCGTAMELELYGSGGFLDLECRHCGLVDSVSVRCKNIIKPEPLKESQQTKPEGEE